MSTEHTSSALAEHMARPIWTAALGAAAAAGMVAIGTEIPHVLADGLGIKDTADQLRISGSLVLQAAMYGGLVTGTLGTLDALSECFKRSRPNDTTVSLLQPRVSPRIPRVLTGFRYVPIRQKTSK